MALSESEKQELDRIASGIEHDDPRLAALMKVSDLGRYRWRRNSYGILVALAGLALMLASFPIGNLALGVTGFFLMGGGTYWATLLFDGVPRHSTAKIPNLRPRKDTESP